MGVILFILLALIEIVFKNLAIKEFATNKIPYFLSSVVNFVVVVRCRRISVFHNTACHHIKNNE
jgi:hypothetical protein